MTVSPGDSPQQDLQGSVEGTQAQNSLTERWESTFIGNYATPNLMLTRGEGTRVWDVEGREYLDLLAGIAVNILGHAHPEIVQAVGSQVARLGHVSNLYASDVAVGYAERLSRQSGDRRVLLVNSGAEANEAALKLVRRHAHERDAPDGVVVAFEGSFHGRTLGTLELTGQPAHKQGFDPLPGGVLHVPYNDPGALEQVFADHDVVGVFAEYVQGEGGVVPMQEDTARVLKRLSDTPDVLLVADEVQTGIARTGTFYAHQQYGHDPDLVTVAKGLGGGLPLGALLAKPGPARLLGPGSHGCTFGGNPVAVAAGDVVLRLVEEESLADRAAHLGRLHAQGLDERLGSVGLSTRGLGLLQGVPLPEPVAPKAVKAIQDEGVLVGQAGKQVVRMAPPLIIGEDELTGALGPVAQGIMGVLDA